MDKFIYVAMSGAKQIMAAQNVHANNLANASTDAFKADHVQSRSMPLFGDVFASRVYGMSELPSVDYSSGPIDQTGRNLDVAIAGDGWFTVLDQQGNEAMTRAGNFRVDESGYLTTAQGNILMGNAGPVILPPFEKVEIGGDGTITLQALGQGPETLVEIDRLKLANPDVSLIEKNLDGLFRRRDGLPPNFSADVAVTSGFLEGSNINPVESLIEILKLGRQFELQLKLLKKSEEMDAASARLLHS